ncbi:MAG TPA: DMT family transporter [Methylomirabilota bacterium]|nr:DMT family transporter [Methylomirabilota bacterium]
MPIRDLGLLLFVCFVWAVHTIIAKIAVTDLAIPPLFYAAIRYAVVAVVALPWILPLPRPLWRVATIAFLLGGCSFALFFTGMTTATPSSAAIVLQLGLPMTTLLSVFLLDEVIGWRRITGIALTFAGAVLVMWDPNGLIVSAGLLFIAGAALASSLGAVMMKQTSGVAPMQFQAWVGVTSALPLGLLSAVVETGQIEKSVAGGWAFVGAVLFSALVVSVVGHTIYYRVILRHEANVVAPLMLISPLMTVALGILVTGDTFDLRMMIGTAVALAGLLIITLRRNRRMPQAPVAGSGPR